MDIEVGNAGTANTAGTGWFIGFSDWTRGGKANLRHVPQDADAHGLCVKWMHHPRGDTRGHEPAKPISEGRTMNLMISEYGRLHLQFCRSATFAGAEIEEHELINQGDFFIWGAGLFSPRG